MKKTKAWDEVNIRDREWDKRKRENVTSKSTDRVRNEVWEKDGENKVREREKNHKGRSRTGK